MKKILFVVLNSCLWFVIALLFAAMYASVEGSKPWAENLSNCWRPDPGLWWVQVLYWFPNFGREVNGLDTFGLLLFGTFGFFLVPVWYLTHSQKFSFTQWLEVLAYFIAISVIEDWVWYLINPAFGIYRFSSAFIPPAMHHWFWVIPTQYAWAFLATIPVGIFSQWPNWKWGLQFLTILWGTMLCLALIVAGIAQYYWIT